MRKTIVVAVGVIVLCLVNYSIYQREQLLSRGAIVLLELAPVDPRSLMQGDYMALRFAVANNVPTHGQDGESGDGYVVLSVDEKGVGSFARLDQGGPLADREVKLRYRLRNGQVKFATNAFFFQEGQAERYAGARYGEFRVAGDGESILTGMHDGDLHPL